MHRLPFSSVRQPVPFGKYLLLDRISVGGMAEVFKAKSYGVEGFEKIIAIKRILPSMGEDRDFIKMFVDEAKIAGQLAHANICQIFELGRIEGAHFIAMEYIWGKDLLQIQNRLRKSKQPLPVTMACYIISKICEGLDYAHRKKDPLGRALEIVHRDCSPQNILISYEGEVKIIDFGIAKATSRSSRTMAGVLKGKFGYMSPEQVRGLPLDRRSDIFALGTMLFECLVGERLFQGETDFSTLEKVRNVEVPSARALNPEIPEAVERVLLKALAKDVEDRYQWCSEMGSDLQNYLTAQQAVFTAKTMSTWLRDQFSTDIERERQRLEEYKRLGRDGLFAGVPAAQAKVDVVETLGPAGQTDDPTVLGGPNFADMVKDNPAAAAVAAPAPAPAARRDSRDDFAEEAPTELFGEIDAALAIASAAAARRAPSAPDARVITIDEDPGPVTNEAIRAIDSIDEEPDGSSPHAATPPPGYPYPPSGYPYPPPGYPPMDPAYAASQGAPGYPYPYPYPYPGQPHPGQPYPGQAYPGQQYSGQPYPGQPYPGQAYPGQPYPGQPYPGGYPYSAAGPLPAPPGGAAGHDTGQRRRRRVLLRDATVVVAILAVALAVFLVIRMGRRDSSKSSAAQSKNPPEKVASPREAGPPSGEERGLASGAIAAAPGPGVAAEAMSGSHGSVDAGAKRSAIDAGREVSAVTVDARDPAPAAPKEPRVEPAPPQDKPSPKPAATTVPKPAPPPAPREEPKPKDPPGETASEAPGYLIAYTTPYARVFVDGVDTGKSTPIVLRSRLELKPGKHKLTFEVDGQKFVFPVTIKSGETLRFTKDLLK